MTTRLAQRLADIQYAAAWRLARALPAGVTARAFRLAADLAARYGRGPAAGLRRNLARVVPDATPAELDALVRAGLRSYARYWCEMFRLRPGDAPAVHALMDRGMRGTAPFYAAVAEGRGVVFAVPHSGNWDAAGVWVVETLRRLGREPVFTTMAQRLRPESLFRRFLVYRESLGFEVVAAEAGPRHGCGATSGASCPRHRPRSWTPWCGPACAATRATGARCSGCGRMTPRPCTPSWTGG